MSDLRKAIRKMERNNLSYPRPPFLNGWHIFALIILLIALPGTIEMGDALTLGVWCGCLALTVGARAVQYFIQRR